MENNNNINNQQPNNDYKGQQQSQNQNQHINIYTHGTNVERTHDGVKITPIVKSKPFYKSWKFWLAMLAIAIAITMIVFGILWAMDVEIFGEIDTDSIDYDSGSSDTESPDFDSPDFDSPDFDWD